MKRIKNNPSQHVLILAYMQEMTKKGIWISLEDIGKKFGFPLPSISAQLRHLRKEKFGSHVLEKRMKGGKWTYMLDPPDLDGIKVIQLKLNFEEAECPTGVKTC